MIVRDDSKAWMQVTKAHEAPSHRNSRTERLPVPGGWLYRISVWDVTRWNPGPPVFVPDPTVEKKSRWRRLFRGEA